MTEKVLSVQHNRHLVWRGTRRQVREHAEYNRGRYGSRQWYSSDPHHLFMIDSVVVSDSGDEAEPSEGRLEAAEEEDREVRQDQQGHRKDVISYYDRRQQLELVLAAQSMSEVGIHKVNLTIMDEAEQGGEERKGPDIWQDATCLALIKDGVLPDLIELDEGKRVRKRAANYYWKEQKLFFKDLYVPKPDERKSLVLQMHADLGHSGEQRLLSEICRRYFWYCRTEDVRSVVRSCQQCQLVKSEGNVRSGDERLKSIPICDLFYRVAMDTVGPLPETKAGNKYILVAIDHYSKWCEAKAVADHGARTATRFLEDDLICRYGVLGFVLTDNGGEWSAEFEAMCKDYSIQHQRTAPQWP